MPRSLTATTDKDAGRIIYVGLKCINASHEGAARHSTADDDALSGPPRPASFDFALLVSYSPLNCMGCPYPSIDQQPTSPEPHISPQPKSSVTAFWNAMTSFGRSEWSIGWPHAVCDGHIESAKTKHPTKIYLLTSTPRDRRH